MLHVKDRGLPENHDLDGRDVPELDVIGIDVGATLDELIIPEHRRAANRSIALVRADRKTNFRLALHGCSLRLSAVRARLRAEIAAPSWCGPYPGPMIRPSCVLNSY